MRWYWENNCLWLHFINAQQFSRWNDQYTNHYECSECIILVQWSRPRLPLHEYYWQHNLVESEKCNACKTASPGPAHIKFLPKQPLPRPRPRATYLAQLRFTLHPRALARRGPALARSFPNNFPCPGLARVHLTRSHTVHPSPLPVPPLSPAQIIHNVFKAWPALSKPAWPNPNPSFQQCK